VFVNVTILGCCCVLQEPLSEFRFGDTKVLDTKTWTWSNVEVRWDSLGIHIK
jgi:hypothetical protein